MRYEIRQSVVSGEKYAVDTVAKARTINLHHSEVDAGPLSGYQYDIDMDPNEDELGKDYKVIRQED